MGILHRDPQLQFSETGSRTEASQASVQPCAISRRRTLDHQLARRWVGRAAALMLAGLVALLPSGNALAVPSACTPDPRDVGLMAVRIAEAGTGVGRRIVETDSVVVGAHWGGEFSSSDGGYT